METINGREFTIAGMMEVLELYRFGCYEYYMWNTDLHLVLVYGSETQLEPAEIEAMYKAGDFDDLDICYA